MLLVNFFILVAAIWLGLSLLAVLPHIPTIRQCLVMPWDQEDETDG